MKKTLSLSRLVHLSLPCLLLGFSQISLASGFQLFEESGAYMANYGAGGAAIAEDASTAFFNPAGLVRIEHQQIVGSLIGIRYSTRFNGTATWSSTSPLTPPGFSHTESGKAFSEVFLPVPAFHYAAPICKNLVFGFSMTAPFGLKTIYSTTSLVRYSATDTEVKVIDFSPSIGFKVTDKLSLGAGFDADRLTATFDSMAGIPTTPGFPQRVDTLSENTAKDWGYGWNIGALYQFNRCTRLGIDYRSQVVFHPHGNSKFIGPLAGGTLGFITGVPFEFEFDNLRTATTLPATTTVSAFHDLNRCWGFMGSVVYTNWKSFRQLTLRNVAGVSPTLTPTALTVVAPQNFHNTWRVAVGADYHPCTQWTFRAGMGWDQDPTNNTDRSVRLPDNNRFALAAGAHYQPVTALGLDVGYTHLFFRASSINNTTVQGSQVSQLVGKSQNSADLIGGQVTYSFA